MNLFRKISAVFSRRPSLRSTTRSGDAGGTCWVGKSRGALELCLLLLCFTFAAQARVNVVTLPGRDSTQLTIYNSVDLTLVKETRVLTFRKGLNRLEFSWANTLIDPTSVEFRALTHADEVEVMDTSFPPRVTNTLEWKIKSEFAGEVKVEIRYFTSGISWAADYVAEANKAEQQMTFSGAVRVTNNSGEDYDNAQIRLVVGVIRLVEDIANLARTGRPTSGSPWMDADGGTMLGAKMQLGRRAAGGAMMKQLKDSEDKPREIVKEGMSEYFLYSVGGQDDIPTGWSKRLPSFDAPGVPITSYYKYERERWGDAVMRYYRFTNSVPSKLGKEPLPDGAVKAFRTVTDDKLYAFVGRTAVKYIPVGESVELEFGNDQEVMIKPKLMNWEKVDLKMDDRGNLRGWTIKEQWEIELQNSKEIPVTVDIRRNFSGDWTLTTTDTYEKVDGQKVKFVVPLAPGAKRTLKYELVTRHGLNATR